MISFASYWLLSPRDDYEYTSSLQRVVTRLAIDSLAICRALSRKFNFAFVRQFRSVLWATSNLTRVKHLYDHVEEDHIILTKYETNEKSREQCECVYLHRPINGVIMPLMPTTAGFGHALLEDAYTEDFPPPPFNVAPYCPRPRQFSRQA